MIGPISNRPNNPVRPTSAVRRQNPRLDVNLNAIIESDGTEHHAEIRDVSTTGAAILGSPPKLSNDMFVALHIEGMNSLDAKVVREFQGGYAVHFTDPKHAINEQQMSKFRSATQRGI